MHRAALFIFYDNYWLEKRLDPMLSALFSAVILERRLKTYIYSVLHDKFTVQLHSRILYTLQTTFQSTLCNIQVVNAVYYFKALNYSCKHFR